ncbi:kinetochore scaffold 1 isoform X2 [Amphiprion ocellaris]|uniref:kinetochore scaffold 1 isoform X2 n=1 Tax=Amphiprion ocellaris TaxID=80972 RepID=UPI002410C7D9|nr:kinetochore scaffold 1 isoform X2 [Amphiprion ocellaris]
MEPLDPPKNVDGSGFSKRRISSILKAPWKSTRFPDPEQQENVVECAKPVEKRNSRRVSFAPANDVLLFSKDAKNASPGQTPSQELVTAAETTQNRIQVAVAEDGSQQILGMENLLKAPLHTSQQRDKINFDTVDDFGEKTVMFSTDDAFMDMTHSHTINIANDAEILGDISLQNYDIVPTVKEKDRMFTVGDGLTDMTLSQTVNMTSGLLSTHRNMDVSGEKRNSLASMPCLDPGFENFLASLSKPSGPSTNAMITRMAPSVGTSSEETSGSLAQIKTKRADVDKENQAPACVYAVLEKSLNNSRKIRESSYGSILCPKDDVSLDITEAQTGRIQPSGPSSNRVSTRMTSTAALSSAETTNTNSSLFQLNTPRADVEYQLLSTICPEDDTNMDMTEVQTGRIIGSTGCDDPFQFLFPTQDMYPHCGHLKTADITPVHLSSETLGSSNHKGMETSLKPSFKATAQKHQEKLDTEDNYRETTVRFTADEACMDVTQSHTVNIATNFSLQAHQNLDFLPTCGEETLRFATNDATMDMTQCLTVDIASNLVSNSGLPLKKQEGETFGPPKSRSSSAHSLNPASNSFLPPFSKPSDPSVSVEVARMMPTAATFSGGTISPVDDLNMDMTEAYVGCILEGDAFMDMTETQTGRIIEILGTADPLECLFPTKDTYPQSGNMKKAKMTSTEQDSEAFGPSNGKGIAASLKTSLKTETQIHQVESDVEFDCKEKTVRFTANEACMDVTQSHTVNIATNLSMVSQQKMDLPANGEKTVRFTATDANMDVTQSHTVNIATDVNLQPYQNVDLPGNGEKTVRFTANEMSMDVTQSHTVNIATDFYPKSSQNVDFLPTSAEKTVRFTANEAAMDVTRSHTVNIATDVNLPPYQNVDLPGNGEKTVRFTANEASMDVTKSHTVNIATDLSMVSRQKMGLPANGEKTVRFTATDANMDVTKSHTVNIATDLNRLSRQSVGILPANGEKTVKFPTNEACMDVTQRHTVNIATDFEPKHENVDFLPTNGEKMMRFTTNDATMDMTQCLTVNITSNVASESILPHVLPPHQNMDFPSAVNERKSETSGPQRNISSIQASDREFKKSQFKTSGPSASSKEEATDEKFPQETIDANSFLVHLKTQEPDVNNENEAPVLVSAFTKKPVNKSMTGCPEVNASMDMTEAQTGYILQQTCTDEPPQFPSSTQNCSSELLKKMEVTLPPSKEGSSNPDDVEITKLTHSPYLNETETSKEPEPRSATCPVAQKMESSRSAADQDDDVLCSRKSRRQSLADLKSRARRLSCLINAAPDAVAIDSCTAPLPQLDHNLDKNSRDKTIPLPELEPEPAVKMGLVNTEDKVQSFTQEEQPSVSATTTPFSLKTKLISRLSVGGFKPKLPQRSKPNEAKKGSSAGEHTMTISSNVAHKLSNFDNDVSDIFDEELGSYEDVSETLDTRSPEKISEIESPSCEFNVVEPLEEDVFEEDIISTNHGQKRPLPEDENNTEDEKRMKASPETAEMASQSDAVECETLNYYSNSHTASIRCEAASESTIKHSLFESQLEDYTSDAQKKLEDGTITVLEFFKLFNIDFVIHNPRQSVLPGRLLSDTDATSMDLLKDRHISRPKQMVYEADVLNLTEEVERLKVRMWDLDKPLKTVNGPLWEEMKHSSENQLKSFGAKLKERSNFFRKTSKVQSHEMKEVLYSNLVQANLEEQQKLRGTIEQADEMIESLDDCIRELETELAAVEKNGFEDKPSLNSLQKEMKKVTETLTENDRQISELEIEKKQNSSKLKRLKAETRNLESHIDVLNMLNEWRFKERRDNNTIYTFLHETMYLHLVYEKPNGTDAEYGSERKITRIAFRFELDDEKSQFHTRIVHKLLSQYIEGESAWVEKYPTSRHVPKLLHDISLVVSRCRLLGEELRLLKMWGGLRLNILDISCVDTQVHIVFSSLKKFSKFEVVFAVSLTNHLYVLQVESFKNVIGSVTIQQIEDIVAWFIPAKNLLTKIVKKIHNTLLC